MKENVKVKNEGNKQGMGCIKQNKISRHYIKKKIFSYI